MAKKRRPKKVELKSKTEKLKYKHYTSGFSVFITDDKSVSVIVGYLWSPRFVSDERTYAALSPVCKQRFDRMLSAARAVCVDLNAAVKKTSAEQIQRLYRQRYKLMSHGNEHRG